MKDQAETLLQEERRRSAEPPEEDTKGLPPMKARGQITWQPPSVEEITERRAAAGLLSSRVARALSVPFSLLDLILPVLC